MKYLIYPLAFVAVALLSSCVGSGFEALNPLNWWAEVDAETKAKLGVQLLSGEWYGAGYTVASYLLGKLGIAGYKKVKSSPAGTLGIIQPTAAKE